jgi:hypothetical protein
VRLQKPVDAGFRDKVALRVGEPHRQLPRRQVGFIQRQVDDLPAHRIGDAVADATGVRTPVLEPGLTQSQIAIVPSDGMDGSPAHRRRWVVAAKEG